MTQFMSMSAALAFRAAISQNNEPSITHYMHQLALTGGQILADAWGTSLLLDDSNIGAMVDVRLPYNQVNAALRMFEKVVGRPMLGPRLGTDRVVVVVVVSLSPVTL